MLIAPNPFDPTDELYACPRCKSLDLYAACEEPGCWKEASNGGPGPDGKYRRACSTHGFWKYDEGKK